MCGEHLVDGDRNRLGRGSSPHVRGARRPRQPGIRPNGIIPACAGSTQVRLRRRPWTEDHPRMCGEHRSGFNALFFLTGSSPHVRGARGRTSFPSRFQGIIPACAGSTGRGSCAWCPPRDHPRMCGEHSRSFPVTWTPQGSSPHVRGAHGRAHGYVPIIGIIPACAGSTERHSYKMRVPGDHPRMCGEHAVTAVSLVCAKGSSPHVRGAQGDKTLSLITTGIIPACAGSTLRK